MLINTLFIDPPVFNSSSFWASSYEQLEDLYNSPYTGAVTTRTSTLEGFKEDPQVHKHAFLEGEASINTYGYSPHPLKTYLDWILAIISRSATRSKPFIISVAPSSVTELTQVLDMIQELRSHISDLASDNNDTCRIGIEFNTSCPNIQGHWPPAYSPTTLIPYLSTLKAYFDQDNSLTIGLKLAPFVHHGQFEDLIKVLVDLAPTARITGQETEDCHFISFISCTNTLGSNLVFPDQETCSESLLNSSGLFGGLGGKPIHTLSLGNVRTFKRLLSEHSSLGLRRIHIIGVGGVTSRDARERMMKAGASAVACATALGLYGVGIFKELA